MKTPAQIYTILLLEYGPQGWWPLSKGRMQTKHHSGPPKNDRDRWEIIVGAILTQNTSWKNVEKAIANLNRAKLLSIDKIRKTGAKKIAELIRPSGYYNQKADRLKIAAGYFSAHFKNRTTPSREELLQVKGIGPETADSILLYAFEQPYFVVDAYTRRIFSSLGIVKADASYEEIQKIFMEAFKTSERGERVEIFKQYHALIVEHAKRHYSRKPHGKDCPLAKGAGKKKWARESKRKESAQEKMCSRKEA